MSGKVRRGMQAQWLRRLGVLCGAGRRGDAPTRQLKYIIREEFGEVTNRLHWHALVAGIPQSMVRPTTCMFLMGFWEGIGGGMARIRVYDAAQDGVSYCTKGLEGVKDGHWSQAGANRYEVGKFGSSKDDSLMLIPSRTLLAEWKCAALESGRLTRLHRPGAE